MRGLSLRGASAPWQSLLKLISTLLRHLTTRLITLDDISGTSDHLSTMSRSRIVNRRSHRAKLPPVHPGEILTEEFLKPFRISQYRLAKDIRVPPRRINEIVHGMRSTTADTALRLARYFGTSPALWVNLQGRYDLEVEKDKLGRRLEKEIASFAASTR